MSGRSEKEEEQEEITSERDCRVRSEGQTKEGGRKQHGSRIEVSARQLVDLRVTTARPRTDERRQQSTAVINPCSVPLI